MEKSEYINFTNISKYISLILRHKPEVVGITLDEHGWADVCDLISGIQKTIPSFNIEILEEIVHTNNKQRYSFNNDHTKIRANQGHSIPVDVELKECEPPGILYHGTGEKSVVSIRNQGLLPQSRLYVHLSKDIPTAIKVGSRHGKPYVFTVQSNRMYKEGFKFFISENGVWLTERVPSEYIRPLDRLDLGVFNKLDSEHIIIPGSVSNLEGNIFRPSHTPQVKKLTILNPALQIENAPFSFCNHLRDVYWENGMDPVRKMRVLGLPFLIAHLDDEANLDHTSDFRFPALVDRCKLGDDEAMFAFGDFFEEWGGKPSASEFYQHAANYWRYRACLRGNQNAKEWVELWIKNHQGKRLPSVLAEFSEEYFVEFPYKGRLLHDLGLPYFDPALCYDLEYEEDQDYIVAKSYADTDGPDETGFGMEDYYWWWILDINFCKVPGVSEIHSSTRNRVNNEEFYRGHKAAVDQSKRHSRKRVNRLNRFVLAQNCEKDSFETAIKEIESGEKIGNWMAYIFPCLFWKNSLIEKYFRIRNLNEAREYLNHLILGQRLIQACDVLMNKEDKNAQKIFGQEDAKKLLECMTMFEYAAEKGSIFSRIIEAYFGGERDKWICNIIGKD